MTLYKRNERVRSSTKLSPGIFSSVPEGTVGVVRRVEEPFFGSTSYEVKFKTGDTMWVKEDHLEPA